MVDGTPQSLPAKSEACAALCDRLGITAREAEVLWWVIHEKSNDEIAVRLGISSITVKNHLAKLFKTLNRRSKTGIAVLAVLALVQPSHQRLAPKPDGDGHRCAGS